uniref:Programmed cell death 1 ligand 2 n=1 Tax=Sphenodon punctatus TaxID=8508 RepID=A0A8D0LB91_SPHPU
MLQALPIVILAGQCHLVTALFTVEVLQPLYIAEHGSNVTMGCRFPACSHPDFADLNIFWEQKSPMNQKAKEVYKLHKGEEDLKTQHNDYRGRATLLHDQLKLGQSVLQIINVKPMDAGKYLCLIQYQRRSDYKYVTLNVTASYKKINFQQVMSNPEENEFILTCQSEGFPLANVFWYIQKNLNVTLPANTTYTLTTDGLYNVTSILRFKPNTSENYSCIFWNEELKGEPSVHIFMIDKRGKHQHLRTKENSDLNPQAEDLIPMKVTDSKVCESAVP